MNPRSLKTFICIFLIAVTAHAVKERGGGNAVVCFSTTEAADAVLKNPESRSNPEIESKLESIRMLDLAEAQAPRGAAGEIFSVVEAKPDENPDQYVARIAKRFEGNIPLFAKFIRDGQKRFKQLYIQGSLKPIAKINDIGPMRLDLDSKCVVMTMMEQRIENNREVMWVDKWMLNHPKHPATSRAVAYLHEYIYAEARATLQHETSEPTREAIGLALAVAGSNSPADLGRSGLSVFEIQKQLASLGFLNSDERLWASKDEVAQYVLDQQILKNGLTPHEPLTTAHKQVEEIVRQIALSLNHSVNDSAMANEYRKKIQGLYVQLGYNIHEHPYLNPVDGPCRPTDYDGTAPVTLVPVDMASCEFTLLTLGQENILKNGELVLPQTAEARLRLKLFMDLDSDLTQVGNKAFRLVKQDMKNQYRPLLQKIEGADPAAVEAMLTQIEDYFKMISLYSSPQSFIRSKGPGPMVYPGAAAYQNPISKTADSLLRLSENALLQHALPQVN